MKENQNEKIDLKEENKSQETSKVKQETIMDTANTKETRNRNKKSSNKTRMLLVILFLIIFASISYIQLRGSYLEYLELGQQYTNVFYTNIIYRYTIMGSNFILLYLHGENTTG